LNIYQKLLKNHQEDLDQLKYRYNTISLFRFLCVAAFLFFLYWYYKNSGTYLLVIMGLLGIVFFVLIKIHQKLAFQVRFRKAIISLTENELAFINGQSIPFKNGEAFETHQHFYSYDLDVFGEAGLFQHLNRTATFVGSKTLANLLQNPLPHKEILLNQEAIKAISPKLNWRHKFHATASMLEDNKETYQKLISWSETKSSPLAKIYRWIAWLLVAIMIALITLMIITANPLYLNLALLLFLVNIGVVFSLNKLVRTEISYFDGVDKITKQYSLLIQQVEETEFETPKFIALKKQLAHDGVPVSKRIQQLSGLIASMDSIQNLLIAVLFNGFALFHIHVLHNLLQWKQQHAINIKNWLAVIGEVETLNSLANFSFNNPNFCFPELNEKFQIEMKDSGHPLLRNTVRINNDVSFNNYAFIILTGSNMSGKSTFLRSLGVNMLLCNIGSCICAASHPSFAHFSFYAFVRFFVRK